uniref:ASCH domain-containing protein n=1 Tax=Panagrolaimus davidi TaxID=227884 RepID=A0A914Q112_9BILA
MNADKKTALLRALGKRKEGRDVFLDKGKTFTVDNTKIHLVTKYSEEEGYSEIVRINDGKTLLIEDKFPVGSICHSYQRYADDPVRYFYDIFCSQLLPQEIEVSSFKV